MSNGPGKPVICDTVVIRNFLLAGVIELLQAIAGAPVHVPTLVFNNDPKELPSELRRELRRGLDFHRAKLRRMLPEDPSYQREHLLVARFESMYDLAARGIIMPEELSFVELLRYHDLTNPQYLRDHRLPTRIHRGEAAAIASLKRADGRWRPMTTKGTRRQRCWASRSVERGGCSERP